MNSLNYFDRGRPAQTDGLPVPTALESMQQKLARCFLASAFVILISTGVAKICSAFGGAAVLQTYDPIFGVSYRSVFWLVGTIEVGVAFACLLGRRVDLQARLVLWLTTGFVIYRLGLLLVGYRKPCSCLGSLTEALHLSPQSADTAMKIILAYLLVGSCAALFWGCTREGPETMAR